MTTSAAAIGDSFGAMRSIVGSGHVRAAMPEDAVAGVRAAVVVEPANAEEVAAVLQCADSASLHAVARGGGSKMDWGNPPRAVEIIVSTNRLNRVIEHADGDLTATVQAGCTFAEFAGALAERRQRLALDPLWPERATIGGILATDDNGPLRAAYGTLRNHLIGITVALADGTLAKSGGKVVKNVAGYDLPKLFTGSFGTLGIITEAVFRLYPTAHATRSLRFVADADALPAAMAAMSRCEMESCAVQFEMGTAVPLSVLVLVEGLEAAIAGKIDRINRAAMDCDLAQAELSGDPWGARERLFGEADSCVAAFSILPTELPGMLIRLRELACGSDASWSAVAQAAGVGLIGLQCDRLPEIVADMREYLGERGGWLTLRRCPRALDETIAVWPDVGSALPIMRRVKEQFDPRCTLAPGRFVGGI